MGKPAIIIQPLNKLYICARCVYKRKAQESISTSDDEQRGGGGGESGGGAPLVLVEHGQGIAGAGS